MEDAFAEIGVGWIGGAGFDDHDIKYTIKLYLVLEIVGSADVDGVGAFAGAVGVIPVEVRIANFTSREWRASIDTGAVAVATSRGGRWSWRWSWCASARGSGRWSWCASARGGRRGSFCGRERVEVCVAVVAGIGGGVGGVDGEAVEAVCVLVLVIF